MSPDTIVPSAIMADVIDPFGIALAAIGRPSPEPCVWVLSAAATPCTSSFLNRSVAAVARENVGLE